MRLLNVNTLNLEEFIGGPGNGIPPYAILSHAWGRQEVTFRDMTNGHAPVAQREGFQKVIRCCAKAKSDGHDFVWIDTCCIDKSCSTELSEAINSMFRWYQGASLCYAYLDDVGSSENPADEHSRFRKSRWFSRGWTLQELIAPSEVAFLSNDWREIGTKRSLNKTVTEITKIDSKSLIECTWTHASIACRMSWASSRNTTRVEDQAYCLMGLFDVNMPVIYGEGRKAFYRLQLEIMKSSDDQSIFAWACQDYQCGSSGLLAETPNDFRDSSGIIDCAITGGGAISYDISKQYIRLSALLRRPFETQEIDGVERIQLGPDFRLLDTTPKQISWRKNGATWDHIAMAVLRCKDEHGYLAIPLRRLDSGEYERITGNGFTWFRTHTMMWQPHHTVLVRALSVRNMNRAVISSRFGEKLTMRSIKSLPIEGSGYHVSGAYPANFIAAPGERPTHLDAISRIKKAMSIVSTIIVFFAHEVCAEHKPFAIRLDRFGRNGSYRLYCRVGPSIKDWERQPALLPPDGQVVESDAQFPLSEDQLVFIRFRTHFINISIEDRIRW